MDIGAFQEKATTFIKKYRYVLLILVVGIIFMLIPSNAQSKASNQTTTEAFTQPELSMNEILSDILSQIEGAGKVRVLLTVAAGEEIIYQADENLSASDSANTTKVETVLITDTDRNQSGLIRQVIPPKYLGAIVVCQGAGSPRIQLAVVDAVSKVTGLGADRISVLRMK